MTAKWSTKSIEQIETMLKANAASGLSRKAARNRHKKCGDNDIYRTSVPALKNYAFHLASDLTSYLLIISAIVAVTFNYSALAAVIFVTWLVNVILTLFTYIKAEKTFECAAFYAMPQTKVIRDGKLYITDIRNIVRGDVILLRAGDIAPCDLRLVSSSALTVLEYDEDKKKTLRKKDATARILDEDVPAIGEHNMVFAGSLIAAGEARAIAVDTGEDTYTYSIMGELELAGGEELTVFEKLGRFCTVWSIAMLVLILPLSIFGVRTGLFDSFMLGLALASSTVSEMLTALGRIIVACSVMNAALIGDENKNNAIIKNISKIEKMPEIDALLILDEGAFVSGEMSVEALLCDDEKALLEGAVISSGLLNSDSLSANSATRGTDEIALVEYARKAKINIGDILKKKTSVGFVPASKYNFDTALVKENEMFFAYVKGDAGLVLPRCKTYFDGKEIRPLTNEKYSEISSFVDEMTSKCRRTVIVASRPSPYNNLQRISSVQNEFTYIGAIVLCAPVIACAKSTLKALKERDTEIVFVSETNNAELRQLLSDTSLIDEVHYSNDIILKKRLFSDLVEKGKKVAVVASSVIDHSFFKDAHASFTCYPGKFDRNIRQTKENVIPLEKEYGTVVAKTEADVIVRRATSEHYGIASVLSAIEYSETVFRNISGMSKYLMCVLAARLFCVLFSVFFKLDIITPAHILFSGLIVDFFAVLVFAFEKPRAKRGEFLGELSLDGKVKNNIFWVILGALFAAFVCLLSFALGHFLSGYTLGDIRSIAFISLVLSQLVFLGECTDDLIIIKRKIKLNTINLFSILFIIGLLILFVLFGTLGNCFNVNITNYMSLIWALVVPSIIFIVSELRKLKK